MTPEEFQAELLRREVAAHLETLDRSLPPGTRRSARVRGATLHEIHSLFTDVLADAVEPARRGVNVTADATRPHIRRGVA